MISEQAAGGTLAALLLACLCACNPSEPQAERSEALPIEILRVSSRVIVLSSLQANVTAIATTRGILLIDTHRSPTLMKHLRKTIEEEFGRSDFSYVVNTHGHSDHCSGNQVFPDAVLVGHESSPEFMRPSPASSLRNTWGGESRLSGLRERLADLDGDSPKAAELRAEISGWEMLLGDLAEGFTITPPSITFRDRLSIQLGDLTLVLISCGETHTSTDIVAYVPEERLLVTGDLFSTRTSFGFSVNKMMDVPRLVSVLEQVLEDEPVIRVVVPGHGELMTGEDLLAIRDGLEERYNALGSEESAARMLEGLMEGRGVEEAQRRYAERRREDPGGSYLSEDEFDTLGYRLLGKGRVEEAIAAFKISVEALPGSALLYDGLAEAYLKEGDIEAAKANYERSLELNQFNRNAAEMLQALEGER
jgi:glyoxylase-like metal-dependent hydrolase (beta-lactamase superfamily II)